MKILVLSFLLFTSFARADEGCVALSRYVGSYKQLSKTCDGPFDGTLSVRPFSNAKTSGFIIESAGIGISAGSAKNSQDKCEITAGTIVLTTCAASQQCLPQNWVYTFSGSKVDFRANGCSASFMKSK